MHDFIIHAKNKDLMKMRFKKMFEIFASLAIDMTDFALR